MIAFIRNIAVLFVLISAPDVIWAQNITDRDLKAGVMPLNNSVISLSRLQPLKFQYNQSKFQHLKLPSGNQFGFIAEDVEKVFPEVIRQESRFYLAGKNDYRSATVKTIDYDKFIPVLVSAINEQQQEIEKLKKELRELKAVK